MPDPRIHPIKLVDDTFVTVGIVNTVVRPINFTTCAVVMGTVTMVRMWRRR